MKNPDATPHDLLSDFLLEQIAEQPNDRALLLYRSIVADTSDKHLASVCAKLADDIVRLQRAQRRARLENQRKSL